MAGRVKEITPKTVIIEVRHFSIFGLSLFKRPLKRTMMMFMKPARTAVYITAYAVQKSLKEVRIVRHGSQTRPQLYAASPTIRPWLKVIKTIVIIKLRLWLVTGCEAKVVAKLNSRP